MAETDKTLSLRIKAEAEGEQEVKRLADELDKLKSEASKPIADPTDQLQAGLQTTEKDAEELESALYKINKAAKEPLPVVTKPLQDDLKQGKQEAKSFGDEFTNLQTRFNQFAAGLAAIAGIKIFTDFADQMIKIREGLTNINKSSEQTKSDLEFLSKVANRLGLDIGEVGNQFLSLTAAAKGTNLQGEETRKIFENVVTAMASLGRTGEEANNALRAIQQMMSKGKISAEELRGQLGEAMPAAVQIFAAALGKTTAELDQLLEQGALYADEVLPRVAAQLPLAFNPEPIDTYMAAWNRLWNRMKETADKVSEEGGVKTIFTSISSGAINAIGVLEKVPSTFNALGKIIGETSAQINKNLSENKSIFENTLTIIEQRQKELQEKTKKTWEELGVQTLPKVSLVLSEIAKQLAEGNAKLGTSSDDAYNKIRNLQKGIEDAKKETEKAGEPTIAYIDTLERLQLAAAGNAEALKKLPEAFKVVLESIKNTGEVSNNAQKALQAFLETPAKAADPTKVLALANLIQLIGNQAEGSGKQVQEGLGKALEKLTSYQLFQLQIEAKAALDTISKGNEDAQTAFNGLSSIIEGVAIASLNKLGIDGVEALQKVDAGFNEILGSLRNLSQNAVVSADVLSQAFEKGIGAATTVEELKLVTDLLQKVGKSGQFSAEQISLAMIDINQKTAELYASIDPLTQALQRFGIDSTEAFTGLDAEMQASISTLDILAKSARVTGDVLYKAVTESIDAANTVTELETLKAKIEEFGNVGLLSANQVKVAIAELNVKLQDANQEIDPLAKAFENLGIISERELKAMADQAVASFEIIKQSGASIGEVNDAFEAMAKKVAEAGAAAGPVGEAMALASLRAKAATQEQIDAVDKLDKSIQKTGTTAQQTSATQVTAADTATAAITRQQQAIDATEKSMIGVQLATLKVGNQLVAAFDTRGIEIYNAAVKSVNDWIEQAKAATIDLNSDIWKTGISAAQELADNMADVQGYADATVKSVRDELVNAINQAKQAMADFAAAEQESLQRAIKDVENLRVANDASAREQLDHKRNLMDLNERLNTAYKMDNSAAIEAIKEQIRVENERHQIVMDNAKAESTESFGARMMNDAEKAGSALEKLKPILLDTRDNLMGFWPDIELAPAFGRFKGAVDGVADKIAVIKESADSARIAITAMTEAGQ